MISVTAIKGRTDARHTVSKAQWRYVGFFVRSKIFFRLLAICSRKYFFFVSSERPTLSIAWHMRLHQNVMHIQSGKIYIRYINDVTFYRVMWLDREK